MFQWKLLRSKLLIWRYPGLSWNIACASVAVNLNTDQIQYRDFTVADMTITILASNVAGLLSYRWLQCLPQRVVLRYFTPSIGEWLETDDRNNQTHQCTRIQFSSHEFCSFRSFFLADHRRLYKYFSTRFLAFGLGWNANRNKLGNGFRWPTKTTRQSWYLSIIYINNICFFVFLQWKAFYLDNRNWSCIIIYIYKTVCMAIFLRNFPKLHR